MFPPASPHTRLLSVFVGALLVAGGMSGCLLGHIADDTVALIGSQSHKQSTLQPTVTKFHKELYWGAAGNGSSYIAESAVSTGLAQRLGLEFADPNRKIVDVQISNVSFQEENTKAEVDSVIRFFRVPSYVVEVEKKREKWVYERMGGWKITDVSTLASNDESGKFGRIVP